MVKMELLKICVKQLFILNLQYLSELAPSTGIQGHTISLPPVNQGGCCLQWALRVCHDVPFKVRFPGIRGNPNQKQRYWIFFLPLSSSFSCQWLQHYRLCEKDTGEGSFWSPYPSVSICHSELTWLLVSCKAVSWLLWRVLTCYQPEHNTSLPWPLHPPLGTVALQAQQSFTRQGICPGAFFSTSCSFSSVVKEPG